MDVTRTDTAPAASPATGPTGGGGSAVSAVAAPAYGMLREGVPLSLLLDLGRPEGPHSSELLVEEGSPAERWWERPVR